MFKLLTSGYDTIECAYYLAPTDDFKLDFENLTFQKEELIQSKSKKPSVITLGSEEFLLASHGSGSGYPYLIQNEAFIIQFGQSNIPNFFVKFRSIALWHGGAFTLHQRFLKWADSVGMIPSQPERLSRVDYAFDYHLPLIDFDEDSFVSKANKDNQHRANGVVQTFSIGSNPIKLRIYNKVDEINEQSQKTWLFDIWGIDQDVWRIEWQVRKEHLRLLGITTFDSLNERQGDLLRGLVKDHTTLRIKTNDTNKSRWPIHPLWLHLIEQVNQMDGLGVVRELKMTDLYDQRLTRIAISVYGYIKRVAAIDMLYINADRSHMDEALQHLQNIIHDIHDPLTWEQDVKRRANEMRLGEW